MIRMKLVTIIAEPILVEKLLTDLKELGARGFTITECRGEGSRHLHAGELPGEHQRVEALVSAEVAEQILQRLQSRYFRDFEIITYLSDVEVVRQGKFE